MDPISYSKASQQEQRIKKFVAQPDSVSGLVTMPSVVATGEVISIPTGRTVVHPNLQVDGILDVQGTLFIPSGGSVSTTEVDATVVKQNGNVVANDSAVVHKTGDETIAGVKMLSNNLVFASGTKITGDFSSATLSNRLAFQNSTPDSATYITAIPNGLGAATSFASYSSSNIDNSSYTSIGSTSTVGFINLGKFGTGTYLPLVLQTGGSERVRIDVSGNLLLTSGSGGLGYGTGSGGTVTQLTSKATAVTLNKPTGKITMNNASLAAGAVVTFQFTNSSINITDTVIVNTVAATYSALNSYDVKVEAVALGYCYITIKNNTGGALTDALGLQFNVIKGSIN